MKVLIYIALGIVFGMVMTQAEIISWFRIQEMFRFQAFHMYGIIGSAIVLGIIVNQLSRIKSLKTINGTPLKGPERNKTVWRNIIGGTLFGLGWALTGACPGPIYVLLGNGFLVFGAVLLSAVLGAFCYGLIAHKLPE